MSKPILSAFLSVAGPKLTDTEKKLLEKHNPVGITLFNRNLLNKSQAQDLICQIHNAVDNNDIFIALDQEGGRVNRLKAAGFEDYASQNVLGRINSPEIVANHCRLIAADMHSIGANLNFAPILDLEHPETNPVLQTRCFGSDKVQTAKLGKIMVNEYIANGICPCIKHLPGHGRAMADPHLSLPIINATIAALADDFFPFQHLNHAPAGMTAHILIPEIDNKNPITFSSYGIQHIIRGMIGFDGFLISDSIDMKALRGTILEKAQASWEAGCDAICYCGGKEDELFFLCQEGKNLSDKALERYDNLKKVLQNKKNSIKLDNERKKYYSEINQFAEEKINYDATEVLHQMQKGEK